MHETSLRVLVTGGAGFIGSNLVRHLLDQCDAYVLNVDKLRFPGSRHTLSQFTGHTRHLFEQQDIADQAKIGELLDWFQPNRIYHLAAETHVDRSIDRPADFLTGNVLGTFSLLEALRGYWSKLPGPRRDDLRLLHVSTDEVMGSLDTLDAPFTEQAPCLPRSPYAATKAGSDHLVNAWRHTYGLPTLMTRCTNNYGPYQFPEKLIPLMVQKAINQQQLPVYGDGRNIRDWMYVHDHIRALVAVMEGGSPGDIYHIGANCERSNLQVVKTLCRILDDIRPLPGKRHEELIEFVQDRPGHDFRYALETASVRARLGWAPQETFESGLQKTVAWYLSHQQWSQSVTEGAYGGERLGLGCT